MSAGSQWAGSKCRQGAVLVMYVCITHTHTHIQSEVNCRPTHTRPLDVTSAVHLLFYCRSPGAVYVCVCGSLLFLALRPGHVPRAYCRLLSLFLPSPCLLVLSPSSVCGRQPSVKVLRFMSKWFVRLPRHLISFLSLFRFHCFTVQRATYTQRNTTELQINKTLLHQTELLSIIYRADNITKHIRNRLRIFSFSVAFARMAFCKL